MTQKLSFSLHIPPEEYQRYYAGLARNVSVDTEQGLRISFPAEHLKPHLTHQGIEGRFVIYFDEENRFKRLDKLS